MTLPTTATASIEIAAPPTDVYALVADITNMGRWSPECHRCEWLDEPGRRGSRFRGHNRRGLARWSTTAEVQVAEPGVEFTFVTLHKDRHSTRWSYTFAACGEGTTLTESFESISSPALIAFVERTVIRNRQRQLEDGMARTLAAVKAAAEHPGPGGTAPPSRLRNARAPGPVGPGMGYREAPPGWWREFVLADPPRTGKLAVVRADGSPHVAPVWVDLDGDDLVFMTSADTIKGKAILRDPRLAVCFDDERPPFSFVLLRGHATTGTDPAELLHWATRIGGRYMGADEAEAYGRRNAVPPEMVVRLHVEHVVAKVDVADF